MSEKKNIDKLFKEQLKDFEVAPNDAVWENIERELHKKKRKRRIIPIWWKFAGVAALLALLFTVGNTFFNSSTDHPIKNKVVDTKKSNNGTNTDNNPSDTNTELDPKIKASDLNTSNDINKHPVVNRDGSEDQSLETANKTSEGALTTSEKSDKNSSVVSSSQGPNSEKQTKSSSIIKNKSLQKEGETAQKKGEAIVNNGTNIKNNNNKDPLKTTSETKNAVVNTTNKVKPQDNPTTKELSEIDKLILESKNTNSTQVTSSSHTSEKENTTSAIDTSKTKELIKEENTIENAIAEAEKEKDSILDDTEKLSRRWSVAPNVAPVYFNTLGNGSSLDNQFVDNTKEGDVTMSYGVKGSYAINKKLKIRAGVNKVDLGYSTKNILIFDGRNPTANSNLQLRNVRIKDSINGHTFVSANSVSFDTGPEILFSKEQGSIDQQLGFIEVPIELEYSLVDNKIGVNVIGGFSTLFLSNNEVYSVQNDGAKTLLGEATNINKLSYSANFGVGVNYNISEQLRFNLEPTFKYQINTFNDTSGDFKPFFIGVYTGLSLKF